MLTPSLEVSVFDLQMFPGDIFLNRQNEMEIIMTNELKQAHPTTDEEVQGELSRKVPKAIITNDRRKISAAQSTTLFKSKELKQAPPLLGNIVKKSSIPKETRTSERTTEADDRKAKYDAFSRAPFIVHFRLVENN